MQKNTEEYTPSDLDSAIFHASGRVRRYEEWRETSLEEATSDMEYFTLDYYQMQESIVAMIILIWNSLDRVELANEIIEQTGENIVKYEPEHEFTYIPAFVEDYFRTRLDLMEKRVCEEYGI